MRGKWRIVGLTETAFRERPPDEPVSLGWVGPPDPSSTWFIAVSFAIFLESPLLMTLAPIREQERADRTSPAEADVDHVRGPT